MAADYSKNEEKKEQKFCISNISSKHEKDELAITIPSKL